MKWLILILLMIGFISIVDASCEDGQIDINSASLEELDELSGIGPVKSQAIIDTRFFDSVDELINVYGIGEVTLEKIKIQGLACVEGEVIEEIIVEEIVEEVETNDYNTEKVIVPVSANVVKVEEKSKVILLNDKKVDDEELIYVSKNAKVIDYLVYVFALFLIFIIGFLIWERF